MSFVPGMLKIAINGIKLGIIITKVIVENMPGDTDERIHMRKRTGSFLEE